MTTATEAAAPPPPSPSSIQLIGLGPEPITVTLHGNRRLLLTQPETVRLEVRPAATPTRRPPALPQNAHWRPYSGRNHPDNVDTPLPTIFRQQVYHCFQHAMLAVILWSHRGAAAAEGDGAETGSIDVSYVRPAAGPFPFVIADASTVVLAPDVDSRPLLLHLQMHDPSPVELKALAQQLDDNTWACLLLLGTLRPAVSGHNNNLGLARPCLRGILLRSGGGVEHGWYACQREGRLWFTSYQHTSGLALLTLPHLPSLNLRLWRKGQATFALGALRNITLADTQTWDDLLRQQLLETLAS